MSKLPTATELTARIAKCVGIWETNRGGNDPAPKESALDTVSGVHASMATIEQATMPYAIDAFARFKTLRDAALPSLSPSQIAGASRVCAAVVKLLTSVDRAAGLRQNPDDFLRSNANEIDATCLDRAAAQTMFLAVVLKARIDALNTEVRSGKTTLINAVNSVSARERLGLGRGSLKSYIRKPRNWGENRAAWQRRAVAAMPDQIAARIEAVAVSDRGTALAIPVIRQRVDKELSERPRATEQQVVTSVSTQNNPCEPQYGNNVWKIYNRLFG